MKVIDRLLTSLWCRMYGHKWCDDGLCDATGWVWQRCECGHMRYHNLISGETKIEVSRHFGIVDHTKSKDYYEEKKRKETKKLQRRMDNMYQ